jgi:hypothetical protein
LARSLDALPVVWPDARNARGRIRRPRRGNPLRVALGRRRAELAKAGITNRTDQDELLKLIGLLPPPSLP